MKGLVAEGALPGILREVYVGRRSGRLHFLRGDERYSLRFVKGAIVHSESSVPQAHLGELMVSLGMIEEAVRARASAIVDRTGKRLGQVLLDMGMRSRSRTRRPAIPSPSSCSTGELILQAVRLTRHPDAMRSGLGDLDRVVIHSSDPLLRFQGIKLTPADGFVLSRVDGSSSARELLQMVPLPPDEAERSLFGLLCTGIIDYLPAEEALLASSSDQRRAEILAAFESLAHRDHFQVLEVPRDASQAEVAAAYHRRARRFHPDAHHERALSDLREPLEAIFERLSVAHEVLRRPASRHEYVASLARVARAAVPAAAEPPPNPEAEARNAEAAMIMAAERAKDGRQWEAIGLLEGLVTVTSGVLRRRARMRLADLCAQNPRSAKSAEEQLTAVIEENPSDVEARLRLARFYGERQMRSRAVECLRQVLELEPDHRGALEMMAAGEGDGPSKGILGRIFGR